MIAKINFNKNLIIINFINLKTMKTDFIEYYQIIMFC